MTVCPICGHDDYFVTGYIDLSDRDKPRVQEAALCPICDTPFKGDIYEGQEAVWLILGGWQSDGGTDEDIDDSRPLPPAPPPSDDGFPF